MPPGRGGRGGRGGGRLTDGVTIEERNGKNVAVRVRAEELVPRSRYAQELDNMNAEIAQLTADITAKQSERTILVGKKDDIQAMYDQLDE